MTDQRVNATETAGASRRRAVVLGAYGLIGAQCVRALLAEGYLVTGIGRDRRAAYRAFPDLDWVICDIGRFQDWRSVFTGDDAADPASGANVHAVSPEGSVRTGGVDVVVNASGALQDGVRDDLEALHVGAVARMLAAMDGLPLRFVQISAAGVSETAPTAFFRTKAKGDALIARSDVDHVILRPVLVISPQAYGGTALLRAAAALPWFEPMVMAQARIACVGVFDVARAVVHAANGDVPNGICVDLTEPQGRPFSYILHTFRRWLGFAPWGQGGGRGLKIPVVRPLLMLVGLCADASGWFGWRSPLRRTALRQIEAGITGDPGPWQALVATHHAPVMHSLDQVLSEMPATVQDRWFSRLFLMVPVLVLGLSLFWIVSGIIGFWAFEAAKLILTERGVSDGMAACAVLGGAVVDIGLGLAVLWRKWAGRACAGMIAVSLGYGAGAVFLAPDLWADPLGPMVKVLPVILCAMVLAAILEDR